MTSHGKQLIIFSAQEMYPNKNSFSVVVPETLKILETVINSKSLVKVGQRRCEPDIGWVVCVN